jgi:hypothetical protein
MQVIAAIRGGWLNKLETNLFKLILLNFVEPKKGAECEFRPFSATATSQ